MTNTTSRLFRVIQEIYCYIINNNNKLHFTDTLLQDYLEATVELYNNRYKTHFNPSKTIHFYMENYHEI